MYAILLHETYRRYDPVDGRTPFYAVSVNGLHRDRVRERVSGRVRVSIRVRDRVRVRACRPDSSGNLLTWRKMEFAPGGQGRLHPVVRNP